MNMDGWARFEHIFPNWLSHVKANSTNCSRKSSSSQWKNDLNKCSLLLLRNNGAISCRGWTREEHLLEIKMASHSPNNYPYFAPIVHVIMPPDVNIIIVLIATNPAPLIKFSNPVNNTNTVFSHSSNHLYLNISSELITQHKYNFARYKTYKNRGKLTCI